MGSDKHDAQVSGGRKVESPRFARGELVQENFAWGLFGGGWNWPEERCRIARNFATLLCRDRICLKGEVQTAKCTCTVGGRLSPGEKGEMGIAKKG